ncbi:MAG: serine hydrolase [Deltaproteobacteria bacterium]|jgi:D-alanyl-D-alanine endopeptidase (penicillin-binding protein 7)|nr:serine hydrolase [Deltaproteobacteria bacterium]
MKILKYFILLSVVVVSVQTQEVSAKKNLRAKAWYVAKLNGKKVYSSEKATKVRSIASISKIMAMLVVLEKGLILDKKTTMIKNDWVVAKGGCRTRLKVGKSYTNRDLLHAAVMGSDNRAVPALGRAVGLNPELLVDEMNKRAKLMGLKHTKFVEPTGIDHDNVSTAKEILYILKAASMNRVLSIVMSKASYDAKEVGTGRKITYNNTNLLTRKRKVVVGKTGFNSSAGYCLATVVKIKNVGPVAFVILGSSSKYSRFADFRKLRKKLF